MLDLRVETFLCVCRHMNFTKASRELNITQPAVSQHIKYLEELYGVKLFCYEKKKLTLTPQGEYLCEQMQAIYHDTQKVKSQILSCGKKKSYRIGATMSIGGFYLSDKLSNYINENPETEISLTVADTQKLISGLNSGKIDFAFVEGNFDKSAFSHKLVNDEEIICVCSADYSISQIKSIDILLNCRLIVREKGSGTREVFETALLNKGWTVDAFKNVVTVNSPEVIRKLLLKNTGISFVYSVVVNDELKKGTLKKLDIPNFKLSHEFNAIWKKESVFSEEFLKVAETFCEE